MTKISYTYSIIKYAHNPSNGEVLNIGVVLYAPSVPYLGFKLESRYKRLSDAFAGFDGEQYRRAIAQFERAIAQLWGHLTEGLPLFDLPKDAQTLVAQVWRDEGLSFKVGKALAGITGDPEQALQGIFERMVLEPYQRPAGESHTDDEVWQAYSRALSPAVKRVLREQTLSTEDYELKFSHTFRNGNLHLLQPLNLDYQHPTNLQEKASRWLGTGSLLSSREDIGKIYFLLGEPRREEHHRAYIRAKNILHKIPLKHELIEENEREDFAKTLEEYMQKHGVLDEEPTPFRR